MASVPQRSFSTGEISPLLEARADQVRYQTGLRTCRNWIGLREGALINRSGTLYLGTSHTTDGYGTTRMIPFVYNSAQSYALVLGDLSLRIIKNTTGDFVRVTASAWNIATVYATGDYATFNGVTYRALAGSVGSQPNLFAFLWFALEDSQYEIPTPWGALDLRGLKFAQSADVMTVTSTEYPTYEIRRYADDDWRIVGPSYVPQQARPTGGSMAGTAGATLVRYRVTAVNAINGEESLTGYETAKACTIDASVTPWVVTCAGHGYATGQEVHIGPNSSFPGLELTDWIITVLGANTFSLDGSTVVMSAGISETVMRTAITSTLTAPSSANPITVSWTAASGAGQYYVYREINGIFGYIGNSGSTSFQDLGYTIDLATAPPTPPATIPWFDDYATNGTNYPGVVAYFQQRLVLAGMKNDTEALTASRIGLYYNFTSSIPKQADDAIKATLAGNQVNEIHHLVEIGQLIVLTRGAEYVLTGNQDGSITPTAINPRQQSAIGCHATLRPLLIGSSVVFVQARGESVHDLKFSYDTNGFAASEISISSSHLFQGYSIVDWDYARAPFSVLWAVRSDGTLLGCTHMPEQEILGWHRHDTGDGDAFESVVAIPGTSEDLVFFVVARTVNGATVRYIERLASRLYYSDDDLNAVFLDCSKVYDGRNTGSTTVKIQSAGPWTAGSPLTVVRSAGVFSAGDVGKEVWLRIGGVQVAVTITAATGIATASCVCTIAIPVTHQNVTTTDWSLAVATVSSLDYLEGRDVGVLADGEPLGSFTVASGSITLPAAYSVIRAGLEIEADVVPLEVENTQGETLIDKQKTVTVITLKVNKTRGLSVGLDEDHLNEWSSRFLKNGADISDPYTGKVKVACAGRTDDTGAILIRQSKPLPACVLALVQTITVGKV